MGVYDYYPETQVQQPNVMGSFLGGVAAPGELQAQQQGLQEGALKIDQLRLALQAQQGYMGMAQRMLTGQGGNADQGSASPSVGRTGGIQNGPQGAVGSAPPAPASTYGGNAGSGYSISPGTAMGLEFLKLASGGQGDPITALKNAQEFQIQQQKIGWANDSSFGGEAFLRKIATSPDADKIVANNPSLMAIWASQAAQNGMDPRALNAHNVNKLGTVLYNQRATSMQLPPIGTPEHFNQVGIGEAGVANVNADTNQMSAAIGRQEPTKIGESYNPDTQQMEAHYQQFAPNPLQGAQGRSGQGGSPIPGSGTAGSTPGSMTVPVGYQKPSDPELKSAMFAGEFRGGNQTMQGMEAQGFRLSPTARSIAVNMATEEDPSAMKQLFSQEIAAHKLTDQEKTYIAAMMPMLQATGHDQSGARLTTAQIRQNLESLVPFSDSNQSIQQIQQNRQGFYTGLLTQAGPAINLAQYKGTLAADLKGIQQSQQPISQTIPGKGTFYRVGGKWFDNPQGK